jgi:hypothetical protein
MNFEEAMSKAAKIVNEATYEILGDYAAGHFRHEDDISPALLGNLRGKLNGQVGGLNWSASIPTHRRGTAAEERRTGADIVIHVSLNTPTQSYSKGIQVQAKRPTAHSLLNSRDQADLKQQCNTMLSITPSAFVFCYMEGWMRCGSAVRVAGASSRDLKALCSWTLDFR